jgi:hypothetical protein
MITIESFDGGEFDGYLALPASGYGPGIVVIQEVFGVNQYMRSVADWYAAHGFVALCPDLFWRIERGIQLTDKGDDWQKAIELYQKIDENKAAEDAAAALEFLRKAATCSGRVGAVGFCMGGKLAYLLSTRFKPGVRPDGGVREGLRGGPEDQGAERGQREGERTRRPTEVCLSHGLGLQSRELYGLRRVARQRARDRSRIGTRVGRWPGRTVIAAGADRRPRTDPLPGSPGRAPRGAYGAGRPEEERRTMARTSIRVRGAAARGVSTPPLRPGGLLGWVA